MNKLITALFTASFLFACASPTLQREALATPTVALADLYVNSATGNDNNNCTQSAPCRTFSRAQTLTGNVIHMTGTFAPFKVSKSDITILTENATLDGSLSSATRCIEIGYFNGNTLVQANNVTVRGFHVTGCDSHGIITNSKNTIIENNTLFNNVLEGLDGGQFGSGIKCDKGCENVVIRNNTVDKNYGECIALTMGKGGKIYNNTTRDCHSPNIYIDNTNNVEVYNNVSYCNSNILGIAMSNEPYNYAPYNWTVATLDNIHITNNITIGCKVGIYYFREGINAGAKNVYVFHNTVYGSPNGISFESGTGQTNIQVRNNLYSGVNWFQSSIGVSQSNNSLINSNTFAVTPNDNPESYRLRVEISVPDIGISTDYFGVLRNAPVSVGAIEFVGSGVTLTPSLPVTFTSAPSLTPSRTPTVLTLTTTPSRTPTRTVTPTVTVSRTPTPLVKPTVCVPEYDVCLVDMP